MNLSANRWGRTAWADAQASNAQEPETPCRALVPCVPCPCMCAPACRLRRHCCNLLWQRKIKREQTEFAPLERQANTKLMGQCLQLLCCVLLLRRSSSTPLFLLPNVLSLHFHSVYLTSRTPESLSKKSPFPRFRGP